MEQRCKYVDYCTTDYRLQCIFEKNSPFGFSGVYCISAKTKYPICTVAFLFRLFIYQQNFFHCLGLSSPPGSKPFSIFHLFQHPAPHRRDFDVHNIQPLNSTLRPLSTAYKSKRASHDENALFVP